MSIDDIFGRLAAEEAQRHWIVRWFKSKGFGGYNAWYWVTHPHKIITEYVPWLFRCWVKWPLQRARRGYSDWDVGIFAYRLTEMIPAIMEHLKRVKAGVPVYLFDDPFSQDPAEMERAIERKDNILDDIAEGFRDIKRQMDDPTLFDYDTTKLERSFALMGEHFFMLDT